MNLAQIIETMNLKCLTKPQLIHDRVPSSAYASDLLSCVMVGAKPHGLWITLMSHANIIAVAALLDLSAIIITENAQPDIETIRKADEQDIVLLSTPMGNYEVAGRLWELGIRSE